MIKGEMSLGLIDLPLSMITGNTAESDTREYRVYQEYLRFYQATKLPIIILTEHGEYEKLTELVGCSLDEEWPEDLARDLKTAYY